MKIAVECKSPLLQKSLEVFLSKHLSTVKQCDIIIKDERVPNNKKCFYISATSDADLKKPFSKAQLILALEKSYKTLYPERLKKSVSQIVDISDEPLEFSILEERIEYLTKEYQQNIIKAIKAFYEK